MKRILPRDGMEKSNRPRARKPGAGLSQMFLPEEGPTQKRTALPQVEGELLCPCCGGPGKLKIDQFNERQCPICECVGIVSRAAFDKYINDHPLSLAAKQLSKKK